MSICVHYTGRNWHILLAWRVLLLCTGGSCSKKNCTLSSVVSSTASIAALITWARLLMRSTPRIFSKETVALFCLFQEPWWALLADRRAGKPSVQTKNRVHQSIHSNRLQAFRMMMSADILLTWASKLELISVQAVDKAEHVKDPQGQDRQRACRVPLYTFYPDQKRTSSNSHM